MWALAGFAGLFIGSAVTFIAWQMYFDSCNRKITKELQKLKYQLILARHRVTSEPVEMIHIHEYATPEQVEDLDFGG